MTITRITAQWSGFRGAPGYSNFYFDGEFVDSAGAEAAGVAIHAFFDDFRISLPVGLSIAIQPTADVIDEASGQILSVVDFTPPATVSGSGTGGYSSATGAVVNWNTNDYVRGRRVRGRTFLVPLAGGAFDTNGDLSTGVLTAIRDSADGLITAALTQPMCVWSRPQNGAGGSSHVVSSATVPDLGAVLRSRRD